MSVSKSSVFQPLSTQTVCDLFEIDTDSQSLIVRFHQRKEIDESLFAQCREEIARHIDRNGIEEIVFDLSDVLVLPSSALGVIASVSQGVSKVRVINASPPAHEDFLISGLYRMVELEPAVPPPK